MHPNQLELVRSTWEQILLSPEVVVTRFYSELFRLDPALFEILEHRLAAQRRVIVPGLSVLVGHLDDPDALAAAARQLGRLQSVQDLQLADPGDLREALLRTLRAHLGPAYSLDVAQAWTFAGSLFAQAVRGVSLTVPA